MIEIVAHVQARCPYCKEIITFLQSELARRDLPVSLVVHETNDVDYVEIPDEALVMNLRERRFERSVPIGKYLKHERSVPIVEIRAYVGADRCVRTIVVFAPASREERRQLAKSIADVVQAMLRSIYKSVA